MVQFSTPFFFVQQSVVSQVDRVHAGYGRHQALKMVWWMSRSSRSIQRPDEYANQTDCEPSRVAGRPRLYDVPLDSGRKKCHGPRKLLSGSSQAEEPALA